MITIQILIWIIYVILSVRAYKRRNDDEYHSSLKAMWFVVFSLFALLSFIYNAINYLP